MAKQSFTTGQVLTAAQMTSLQANDYNQTVSAKVASYVLVATDAGTRITMSNASATTITVNTALFTAGDTLTITNIGAGVCTITAGTATVATAGSLALNQYDSGTLYFTSTGVSIFFGAGAGDITGVTAGTGISGGGTSGTVTITNSMATEITAKGDLIAGTGSATFDNLPVGTNGQTLVADSTASTGLKWATASSITYNAYTPTLSNITLGNGTVTAGYQTVGNLTTYRGVIVWGSTTTVSTNIYASLPVTAISEAFNSAWYQPSMAGVFGDYSTNTDYLLECAVYPNTSTLGFLTTNSASTYLKNGGLVDGAVPITPAVNDVLSWIFTYRTA